MKFLVDNQLPPALAKFLNSRGHDALHVLDMRLDEVDDIVIWNTATAEGRALISKDEDFLYLASRTASDCTFVWVRLGNCRTDVLLAAFDRTLDDLIAAADSGQRVIELR